MRNMAVLGLHYLSGVSSRTHTSNGRSEICSVLVLKRSWYGRYPVKAFCRKNACSVGRQLERGNDIQRESLGLVRGVTQHDDRFR